jgi:hypothetical protein
MGCAMIQPALLDAHLDAWRDKRFDWQRANCIQFAAEWVQRVTGRDPLPGWFSMPQTEAQAQAAIGATGKPLRELVDEALPGAAIPPGLAQAGDVMFLPLGPNGVVGICCGRLVATLADGKGLGFVPARAASHAWRVAA